MYVTNESKATELDTDKVEQIRDAYTQMSLRLQAAFGLRREASIKNVPALALQGIDRPRVPGARRTYLQTAHAEAEAHRSTGAARDQ